MINNIISLENNKCPIKKRATKEKSWLKGMEKLKQQQAKRGFKFSK